MTPHIIYGLLICRFFTSLIWDLLIYLTWCQCWTHGFHIRASLLIVKMIYYYEVTLTSHEITFTPSTKSTTQTQIQYHLLPQPLLHNHLVPLVCLKNLTSRCGTTKGLKPLLMSLRNTSNWHKRVLSIVTPFIGGQVTVHNFQIYLVWLEIFFQYQVSSSSLSMLIDIILHY